MNPDGLRRVTSPTEMRALAHPVRMSLLEALRREGSLTATEACELVGESAANCSFHLRTLAKYGFVEEVAGPGRRRPWKLVGRGISVELDEDDPASGVAGAELATQLDARHLQRSQTWRATRASYPQEWRDAAFEVDALAYLTPGELAEVEAQVMAVLGRYQRRADDRAVRPADSMPISLRIVAHPLAPTASGA